MTGSGRAAGTKRVAKAGRPLKVVKVVKAERAVRKGAVVHEEVFERLKRALIEGELEPGRAVSVRALAARYKVSAMPAREAIRRLVTLGALEMTKTRRIAVATMTGSKIEQLTDVRVPLETRLAVRALEMTEGKAKARAALVARLGKIDDRLDGAISSGDVAAYSKLNSEFHFALYAAAQAPVLYTIAEGLWVQFGPFMRVVVTGLGTSDLVDQHKEAIDALESNDAEKLAESIGLDILAGMNTIAAAFAERSA